MVKKLALLTQKHTAKNTDQLTNYRILMLFLSAVISLSSGSEKKEEVAEYFTRVCEGNKHSNMRSDTAVKEYCEDVVKAL